MLATRPRAAPASRLESDRPDIHLLIQPLALRERLPLGARAARVVARTRREVVDILDGEDDRLLVVVGPCSIHDPRAALEYARRLSVLADELRHELRIVMRVFCEKPRTTVGWIRID
jgi:3-deoxy-7-phosphoheptulonate synthase